MELTELAEKLAERLIGQCTVSLDEALNDAVGLDITTAPAELLAAIDSRVFCCDGCSWYCSTDELMNETGRDLCDDCNAAETDE